MVLILLATVGACSSDGENGITVVSERDAARTSANASIEPEGVRVGERFTVTPAQQIQPICLGVAVVQDESQRDEAASDGLLYPGGDWKGFDGDFSPTLRQCLPEPSSAARTFTVPHEMEPGDYVVCLSLDRAAASCGSLSVVR